MDKHVKKTKTIFLAATIGLFLVIASGTIASGKLTDSLYGEAKLAFGYFKNTVSYNSDSGKNLLAGLMFFSGGGGKGSHESSLEGGAIASSVPVLVYHGIVDGSSDKFSLTEDRFKEHLFSLKKEGWNTISVEDFRQFVAGEKELPDKSFLLTFDDGRKDSYYPADPLLKALGYKAAMFAATGVSLPKSPNNSKYYLSQAELERMAASSRWEIQSHAVQRDGGFIKINAEQEKGNFLSNKMWYENDARLENDEDYKKRIAEELAESKKTIEEKIGVKVIGFSYPFGDYGQQTKNNPDGAEAISEFVKQNYDLAFRQIWPKDSGYTFNYKGDYPYMLKRIEPSPEWSGEYLTRYLEAGKGKTLPYEEKFSGENQWKKNWGRAYFNGSGMELGSKEDTNGSFVFLDGSYPWSDYAFNAAVDWVKGSHVSLVARFKDENNYVSCDFSGDNLRITQKVSGKSENLANKKNIHNFPKNNLRLGMAVTGGKVQCFINGNEVARARDLSPVLASGGIGIKTWDRELNNSFMYLRGMKAAEAKNDKDVELAMAPVKDKLALKESVLAERKQKERLLKEKLLALAELIRGKQAAALKQTEHPSLSSSSSSLSSSQSVSSAALAVKNPPAASSSSLPAAPIVLPYDVDNFPDANGWMNLSGAVSAKEGRFYIGSTASTTTGFAVLDGSQHWNDYTVKARIERLGGNSFSVVARYSDTKNYVSCVFINYGAYVKIYSTVGGKTTTIARTGRLPIPFQEPWVDRNFGARVKDDSIECLIDGKWVVRSPDVKDMPEAGAIGFKTWDYVKGNGEAVLKEVSVDNFSLL